MARPFSSAFAAEPASSGGYCFPVLGDLHFDRLAHHDMDWLMAEKPNDLRQIERYSQITSDVLPKLLEVVAQRVALAKKPVPMIVQVGDLVEGLCGRPDLARLHCEEALDLVAKAQLGSPLLLTKGNHDITGPGAKEAFDDVLLTSMDASMRTRPSGANFVFHPAGFENDWFIFFDGYDPEALGWLERTLADRNPQSGHLFFVVHQPVVPYTARCWHEFRRPEEAAERNRFLMVLAKHRPIVLNGHLHKYGLLARRVQGIAAPITQLSINSVIPKPNVQPQDRVEGIDAYGSEMLALEERFSPATRDKRSALLTAEAAHIAHYEYADAPGYAMIHVTPSEISAEVYAGLSTQPWRRLSLPMGS